MYFFDTETCGFHGPTVLIQYSFGIAEIKRHNVWKEPIIETIALIEDFCTHGVCGFNLAFDWFHICQTYTTLVLLGDRIGYEAIPEDHIELYAELEPLARDGKCLKPKVALDLMLHARKGPYQSTMDRKDIKIKRVPIQLGQKLAAELTQRVILSDIYFSKQKDKKQRWQIIPVDKDFVNVVLKFRPSSALKALVVDACGLTETIQFGDVNVDRTYRPIEVGWAPFALALSSAKERWSCEHKSRKGRAWPGVIKYHIRHWAYDIKATQYSIDDVKYLHLLYEHFKQPEANDDDSVLACMVGAVRWRGYSVDRNAVIALKSDADKRSKSAPKHSTHVRKYLTEVMSPTEQLVIQESTKKVVLETVSKWLIDCDACKGEGTQSCPLCGGTGAAKHPAAIRAAACLDARQSKNRIVLFDKLLQANRFHVSVKVIGALSGRMSGDNGLNATGINHLKVIRKAFTLAASPLVLTGGDFSAFEVSIADACYDDADLRQQLLTCYVCQKPRTVEQYDETYCPNCGAGVTKCKSCKKIIVVYKDKPLPVCCGPLDTIEDTLRKIHGLFAMELYPGKTYDEILASKGSTFDMYDNGKRGIFSQFYGGNYMTLMNRIGICEEDAKKAEQSFALRYEGVGRAKKRVYDDFCSMRQPDGIGKVIFWNEPKEYVESLTGYRRWFSLENIICRTLFELANDPPEDWSKIRIDCVRRDRVQKVGGAVKSAVFAAAFQIQSQNMRAALNHEIQSTGAILTKRLQRRMWDIQPAGINDWEIQPFNVHDEILAPILPKHKETLVQIVSDFVGEHKSLIPLLRMDFQTEMQTWADK